MGEKLLKQDSGEFLPDIIWKAFLENSPYSGDLVDIVVGEYHSIYKEQAFQRLIDRNASRKFIMRIVTEGQEPYKARAWKAYLQEYSNTFYHTSYYTDYTDYGYSYYNGTQASEFIEWMEKVDDKYRAKIWAEFKKRSFASYALENIIIKSTLPDEYKEKAWVELQKLQKSNRNVDLYRILTYGPEKYQAKAAKATLKNNPTISKLVTIVIHAPSAYKTKAWKLISLPNSTKNELTRMLCRFAFNELKLSESYGRQVAEELFNRQLDNSDLFTLKNNAPEPYKAQAKQLLRLRNMKREEIQDLMKLS